MNIDVVVLNALYSFANYYWLISAFVVFFAVYLPYAAIIAFAGIVYLSQKKWRDRLYTIFLSIFSVLIARGLIVETIRFFYVRSRPYTALDIPSLIGNIDSSSMPSGHATTFFALATLMFFINKKYFWYFISVAIVIGVARVMAGVHWPSDIVVGAGVGVTSVFLSNYLLLRTKKI